MATDLWQLRRQKRMTIDELARQAGIHPALIKAYELGERAIPERDLERLAGALLVEPWDIKEMSDPPPRGPARQSPPAAPDSDTERPRYDSGSSYSRYGGDSNRPSYGSDSSRSGYSSDTGRSGYGSEGGRSGYGSEGRRSSYGDSGRSSYGGEGGRSSYGGEGGRSNYGESGRYGGEGGRSGYGESGRYGGEGGRFGYGDSGRSGYGRSDYGRSSYGDRGSSRYGEDRPPARPGERPGFKPRTDRPPRKNGGVKRRPQIAPARPSQLEHLKTLLLRLEMSGDDLLRLAGKPLSMLNRKEAAELLTTCQGMIAQRKPPKAKGKRQRPYLPESVDEHELIYLTEVQLDKRDLRLTLFNGQTVEGKLQGFSPYALTLSKADGEEVTVQKLAIAYYETEPALAKVAGANGAEEDD